MYAKRCGGVRLVAGYLAFVLLFLCTVAALSVAFRFLSDGMSLAGLLPTAANATDSRRVVILDAGHGGEDGGAVGKGALGEVFEKDLNLDIARTLRDLLESDGVTVIMTRDEDVLLYDRNVDFHGRKKVLDLAARLCVGSSVENALFVSIHMNAFPQTQYHGLQVYYSKNHMLSSEVAADIQSTVHRALQPDNTRKVKAAGSEIFLLDRLHCPAVLIECGFLSNPDECAALDTAQYRQKLAFVLFCSLRRFITDETDSDVRGAETSARIAAHLPDTDFPPDFSISLDFSAKARYNGDRSKTSALHGGNVRRRRAASSRTVRDASAQNGVYLS